MKNLDTDSSYAHRTLSKGNAALLASVASAALAVSLVMAPDPASADPEYQSLDGTGNNLGNPALGAANTRYPRQVKAWYKDGIGEPVDGPNTRRVSNRVFSDLSQNVFSRRGVTQWAWVWGQFLDHTFGLREEGTEEADIGFNSADPLERFQNDLGSISFTRSAVAPGTGVTTPREQINTVSSFIDGHAVYGPDENRLDWLRAGSRDGDPSNNDAELLMTDNNYLPPATTRGNPGDAPDMAVEGRLRFNPTSVRVAGDVRANENIGLTAVQTLFARYHNEVVSQLPDSLSEEQKFQIARRVVSATQQWITYNEFLPAMGVRLPRYQGYRSNVDPSISNEFATVGYRAHTQVHGEFEIDADATDYTEAQLAAFEDAGIEVSRNGAEVGIAIPLNVAFFNPQLLEDLGLGNMLAALGAEPQYANDEMIDDQLRSVLFQVPSEGVADPMGCLDGIEMPNCFKGVVDLGAMDAERGRDHGMASYNEMRKAFGLKAVKRFTDVTKERTDRFPRRLNGNNPKILDFVLLKDREGNVLQRGSDAADTETVFAKRRSTLASRLKDLYGSVNKLGAFVGGMSEPSRRNSELGPLQWEIWRDQFTRLRDGDRFFYANDPELARIGSEYGIDFRQSLAQVITLNSDADGLNANVFMSQEGAPAAERPRQRNPQNRKPNKDRKDNGNQNGRNSGNGNQNGRNQGNGNQNARNPQNGNQNARNPQRQSGQSDRPRHKKNKKKKS
ncbi:MAG: peroxidase [Actinobacteria bacterium]|nr:peroxidase [Actinomycetota bacterium]